MILSKVAAAGFVLGGVVWLVTGASSWGSEPGDGLYYLGFALVLAGLAAGGYLLVATAPIWLRAIVTIATALLGGMVWLIVADAVPEVSLALVVAGAVLVLVGLLVARRSRSAGPSVDPDPPAAPAHGRRAAR